MKIQSLLTLAATAALITSASAATVQIAGWSMPNAVPSATTGSNYTYGAANLGDLTSGTSLSGFHTNAATTWTSPSGNGSTYSLSCNNWNLGDYFQVSMATTGYSDISVSWDQTRSSTGPSSFSLSMSTDGGAIFTTLLGSYTVIQAGLAGTGTTTWNSVTTQPSFFTTTTDLGISAADQGNILLRFYNLSTSLSGAGTSRIDNISVVGTVVPEPTSMLLLMFAGGMMLIRRKR